MKKRAAEEDREISLFIILLPLSFLIEFTAD